MEADSESSRNTHFAIMWDCHGLEAVQYIPDPAMQTWRALQNLPPDPGPNLEHWRLRARYNTQRHYEIYIIAAAPGIEKEDIEEMFENNPQSAADTIRRIGHCYHSDRAKQDQVVIR